MELIYTLCYKDIYNDDIGDFKNLIELNLGKDLIVETKKNYKITSLGTDYLSKNFILKIPKDIKVYKIKNGLKIIQGEEYIKLYKQV